MIKRPYYLCQIKDKLIDFIEHIWYYFVKESFAEYFHFDKPWSLFKYSSFFIQLLSFRHQNFTKIFERKFPLK
jgi:hypothetical protein